MALRSCSSRDASRLPRGLPAVASIPRAPLRRASTARRRTPLQLAPACLLPTLARATLAFAALLLAPLSAQAAALDGADLSLLWAVPFVAMLLSIALGPILAAHWWHEHFGWVSLGLAALFVIPCALFFGGGAAWAEVVHAVVSEYIPFIVLLGTLYCVAGGIHVRADYAPSPSLNVSLLAVGSVLASLIGTTGAAMLMIRPVIRANAAREHKVHVIVFFICLVANAGGALTPLGDPPLFVGFLRGVDFFWTAQNMAGPTLVLIILMLLMFWVLDSFVYGHAESTYSGMEPVPSIILQGARNIPLLAAAVGAVLMSGVWKTGIEFDLWGTPLPLQNLVRDLILVCISIYSLRTTPALIRESNGFTWGPILEVVKLFIGIFITIIPVIAILKAGSEGHLRALVHLVEPGPNGSPDAIYFWLTGLLSAFLDNVPTYLVFFNLAGGDAQTLMHDHARTLMAISSGAVFMGALTYIGNAPNLMVKAIAEEMDIKMPGFFGYLGWTTLILTPNFALITWFYFLH